MIGCVCSQCIRAIFTWVSEVIRNCFGFALLRLLIGLKISRHFLNQSEVKPGAIIDYGSWWNQSQSWLAHIRFPALRVGQKYLLCVLIGLLDCLCLFWLARMIALVLILRHSFENRSNIRGYAVKLANFFNVYCFWKKYCEAFGGFFVKKISIVNSYLLLKNRIRSLVNLENIFEFFPGNLP